jgi:hypothetical protein
MMCKIVSCLDDLLFVNVKLFYIVTPSAPVYEPPTPPPSQSESTSMRPSNGE